MFMHTQITKSCLTKNEMVKISNDLQMQISLLFGLNKQNELSMMTRLRLQNNVNPDSPCYLNIGLSISLV